MRDWHDMVIKLQEARNIITDTNLRNGSTDLHIGVIEDYIQYIVNSSALPLSVENYRAAHPSFSDLTNTRKVF